MHTAAEFVSERVDGDRSISYSPTQIYRIGVGDVLYINILNSSDAKGFYSVRNDGTIDYALAGDNIVAQGRTPEALGKMLASGITLFRHAKVEVRVREYASHRILLSGLVSNGGVLYLQRESIPLFVICAGAEVNPKARKVAIRNGRTNAVSTYDLRDPNTLNVVINPGDELDFLAS
jgi:protein involved in polysaccharide export with SLBB domain